MSGARLLSGHGPTDQACQPKRRAFESPRHSFSKVQAGFSLAETLLSLSLGLTLSIAMVQTLSINRQTQALVSGRAQLRESAQIAMQLLGNSIRGAGYLGCAPGSKRLITAFPGGWSAAPESDLRHPVSGLDGGPDDWTPPLTTLPEASKLCISRNGVKRRPFTGNRRGSGLPAPGSDILIVSRMRPPHWELAREPGPGGELWIKLRDVNGDGRKNSQDLDNFGFPAACLPRLVITDCQKATLFQATSVAVRGGQAGLGRDIPSGGENFAPRSLAADAGGYPQSAVIAAAQADIYYVATGTGASGRDSSAFSLWHKSGTSRPLELVEGIENLQLLYGLDTDGDGTPDLYQPPGLYAASVVTVRVSLVATSVDAVTAETEDGRLRQVFTSLFTVRNGKAQNP